MTTLYDTSTEVDTAEAERLLRRPAKQALGNGQSADGFDTHWPMRPFTESEPA